MKTNLLFLAFLCAIVSSVKAQTNACDIITITTEYVSSSASAKFPGKCDVTVNISWEQVANSGNKFSFFHIWQKETYQPFSYSNPSNPPSAADISATLGTIIVKDPSSANPTLYTTYVPDENYTKVLPLQGYSALTLRKVTVNNIDRFTVENVVLAGVTCNTNGIYEFISDCWSSQHNQGKNIHCVGQNNPFTINEVIDRSMVNCSDRTVQIQLLSNTPQATGTYQVYADMNLYGKFDPSIDALLVNQNFTTSSTIQVSGTWGYRYLSTISIPAAYNQNNIWVQVNPNGGKATQVFIVGNGCTPLAVIFSNFSASRNKSNVNLKWQTNAEQNTKGFSVQRKTTGDWETIGFVPSKSGGNSTATLTYDFSDVNSFKGISQYQIVEVSTDGKQKKSEIKAVKGESQSAKVLLYPNPTNNSRVNLVFEGNSVRDITIHDMTGRVIKQVNNTTNNNVMIDGLQSGFYTVQIVNRSTNEVVKEKLVVNNR